MEYSLENSTIIDEDRLTSVNLTYKVNIKYMEVDNGTGNINDR